MTVLIRTLGCQPYIPIWQAMQRFTDLRTKNTPDEIWLLEHEPVYTQGMAGKPEHIIDPQNIPLVPIDRGGQVTYHGPGQLVIYFLLDVEQRKLAAGQLVRLIERFLIELLGKFHIVGSIQTGAPGIYVDTAKIASIGLRIRKNSCYHGLALNVAMDLTPFSGINPCGHTGMKIVQISDFQRDISLTSVANTAQHLCERYFDAR